ncbi:MAG TPA: lytic transglycosylase domain-containing protein [Sphingomonas sp.]|nr:lytic transglycosylase domain-containing protein [Sphingomonas sp.]
MSPLKPVLAVAAFAVGAPADAQTVERWRAEIGLASARCAVPARWIERVMRAESGGRTMLGGRPIRSPRGAIGLMQLMPGTWAEMRAALGLGANPDDPRDNIIAGACYLRRMYDRFGYPGLFGAYNAGPARYAAWIAGRRQLPGETIAYLAAVAPPPASPAGEMPMRLFVVRRGTATAAAAAPSVAAAPPAGDATPGQPALFTIRRDLP